MYLVSQRRQDVHINGQTFAFDEEERILTEYSYKYDLASFAEMAANGGFTVQHAWTDDLQLFAVHYLQAC
jgi:uncharacterized SAM-dependent methyltransferase